MGPKRPLSERSSDTAGAVTGEGDRRTERNAGWARGTGADEVWQVLRVSRQRVLRGVEGEKMGFFMIASDDHGISLSTQAQVKKRPL